MFSYLAVFHERALRIRGRDSLNLYVVGPSGTWRFAYFSHVDNDGGGDHKIASIFMWSQISWSREFIYMKMMIMMMIIITMMALSTNRMIVWNDFCQNKQKACDLVKQFAKRTKQTFVSCDILHK